MITAEKTQCYHCGEACEHGLITSDDKSFCCDGCRSVYDILKDGDLCQYYAIDGSTGVRPDLSGDSGRFVWLDDPRMKETLMEFRQGNRCHVTFSVPGMHCSSCIWLLENLHRLDKGVIRCRVDFPSRKASVEFDETATCLRQVVEWMARIGYEPVFESGDMKVKTRKSNRMAFYKIGVAGFCFGNIMMLSLPDYFSAVSLAQEPALHRLFMLLSMLLSLPVVFFSASDFFISALRGLRGKYLNIDMPVALAIGVTFLRSMWDWGTGAGAGYFDSMAGIVFFMLIGRFFQNRTWTRLSFDRDFRSYFPVAVTVVRDNTDSIIPVSEIKVGDRLRIRNMELVPADAVLTDVDTTIDYSFVTGESVPVEQKRGDKIYAGGRLTGPMAEMTVIRPMEQSYLTRLWNNPAFAKTDTTDQTRYVEGINRWFTAATLLLAFGTLFFWMPSDMTRALNAFTAVLIIACPCALLLAATFTHGNMLRILGLNGLYLRNAKVIERFAEADTLVFDKTGTITHGKSSDLEWHGEAIEELERELVGFLAMQSAHPYSRLIASHWAPRQTYAVDGFKEVPGEGVEAIVDGLLIKIGSRAYVGGTEMSGVKGSVWIRVGHRVAGCFSVRQPYRDGISELAEDLHASHQIHLLSGDNDAEKSRILALFGDDVVMNFRQSPEDKMAYIEHLQSNARRVVMLGDGLNDAGALARSDVGIAVTDDLNRFSPACDIILDGSRLAWLKRFVEYARKGKTIVTAAFGVSLVYNVIGLSYAVSGLLSPVIAAIIMPLMSMSIVALSTLMGSVYARKLNLIVSAESNGGVP